MKKDIWYSLPLSLLIGLQNKKFKSTREIALWIFCINIWSILVISFLIYYIPSHLKNISTIFILFGALFSLIPFLERDKFNLSRAILLTDWDLKRGDKINLRIKDEVQEGEISNIFIDALQLTYKNRVIETISWSYFQDNIHHSIWVDNHKENVA